MRNFSGPLLHRQKRDAISHASGSSLLVLCAHHLFFMSDFFHLFVLFKNLLSFVHLFMQLRMFLKEQLSTVRGASRLLLQNSVPRYGYFITDIFWSVNGYLSEVWFSTIELHCFLFEIPTGFSFPIRFVLSTRPVFMSNLHVYDV